MAADFFKASDFPFIPAPVFEWLLSAQTPSLLPSLVICLRILSCCCFHFSSFAGTLCPSALFPPELSPWFYLCHKRFFSVWFLYLTSSIDRLQKPKSTVCFCCLCTPSVQCQLGFYLQNRVEPYVRVGLLCRNPLSVIKTERPLSVWEWGSDLVKGQLVSSVAQLCWFWTRLAWKTALGVLKHLAGF